jgi:hypothetical protein
MRRRDFLKAFVGSYFIYSACSKESPQNIFEPPQQPKPPKNPFDDWVPMVNSEPYFVPDYSASKAISDQIGNVSFADKSTNKVYSSFFIDSSRKPISDLEVLFYNDHKFNKRELFFIKDPKKRFMPEIISLRNPQTFIQLTRLEDATLKCDSKNFVCSFRSSSAPSLEHKLNEIPIDLFIKEINFPLPNFDPEDMNDLPGYVYIGDWSFTSLKNLVTVIKYGTVASGIVMTFATGSAAAPVALKAYSVISSVENFVDVLDQTIDGINLINRVREGKPLIDKDKEYSIYADLSGTPHLIFFPSSMINRKSSYDIRYLIPINEGNSWIFSDGIRTVTSRVLGKIRFKGKDLVRIRNTSGFEEYYGFYQNTLYLYGFSFPQIGDIIYDPPIKVGDNSVYIGKRFQTNSRIISPISDVSGTINEVIDVVDRENVLLSRKIPYGDCIKMRENSSITVKKGDQSISDSMQFTHWFSNNLGKIKTESQGQTIELLNSTLNSRMQGFTFPPSSEQQSNAIETYLTNTLSERVARAYLNLMRQ